VSLAERGGLSSCPQNLFFMNSRAWHQSKHFS